MRAPVLLLGLLFSSACAAGRMAEPAARAEQPAEPGAGGTVEFERILGSFSVKSEIPIYLNPRLLEHGFNDDSDYVREGNFAGLIAEFRRLKVTRGEAAARLNHAATLWFLDEADTAYAEMRAAQVLFMRAGDLQGEAHAHEWLGFFFRESEDAELAEEHLALAYQMFIKLENIVAAERVLSYAGPVEK
jgi:hypothetical protein